MKLILFFDKNDVQIAGAGAFHILSHSGLHLSHFRRVFCGGSIAHRRCLIDPALQHTKASE
jgi:hypothetical protein